MNHMKMVSQCFRIVSVLVLVGFAGPALAVDNIDPNDTNAQFAWGENTGWMNGEPGGDGGPGVFVEDDGLTGYLWSENTGWVSLSCLNTASCGASDYGVTNTVAGILAGYAWSENAGWISFSCTNDADNCATKNYGVTIDPATGEFSGRAWSENTGWITFRNTNGGVSYGVTTSWPNGGVPACVPAPDADLNNDGIVNILDLSQVGSCFGQDPTAVASCQIADTNCDDAVNFTDIQFVVGSFGQTVP